MLLYFAILLIPLIGFSGLAIDVGRLELRKMQLQLAADAGALSAAAELQHANYSHWQDAATTEVTANATLNNYPAPNVNVHLQASSGFYAGDDDSTVQVTLTQTVPTTLLQLLGATHTTLTVQAVAMIPPCIFFLGNPSNGSADVNIASAGLNNNNACPAYAKDGFIVDGFAHICCTTPKTPSSGSGVPGGGWTVPSIQYTSPTLTDPLAYVTAPVFSSCPPANTRKTYAGTIGPGTYCGTLKVNPGTTLNMQPGRYIITGGVNFNNATINGPGVTLYLTQGGGSGFGTFNATGSILNLSAPTDASSGGIPGIMIFGDRAWTGGNEDFIFYNSQLYGDGIIYTTGTGIYDWQTNMAGPNYFTLVTANLYLFGANINPSANYSPVTTGDPLRLAVKLVQ